MDKTDNLTGPADQDRSNTRSWQKFAELIASTWRKPGIAIIETAQLLSEAKQELPRVQFDALTKLRLPFDSSVARKLLCIAACPLLCAHGHKLPPCWTTIYELSKLDTATLQEAMADGRVSPKMQRRDVRALRAQPATENKSKGRLPLLIAWRQATDSERANLFDSLDLSGFLKALSPAFRRKLESRLRPRAGDAPEPLLRASEILRRALSLVQIASKTPNVTPVVAAANEKEAIASLRQLGVVLARVDTDNITIVEMYAKERRRAA
jgi:hypothetical protein